MQDPPPFLIAKLIIQSNSTLKRHCGLRHHCSLSQNLAHADFSFLYQFNKTVVEGEIVIKICIFLKTYSHTKFQNHELMGNSGVQASRFPTNISWKVAGSIPDEVIGFFNLPNLSSHIVTQGSTQPLTEMSTRNLPGGKGQPAHKAENLATICELIIQKTLEP
jgi:hypothetical protein